MRFRVACLLALAAGFVPFAVALAQPEPTGRGGMVLDRAPLGTDQQRGVLRPFPAEPHLADPRATLPSATLMDLRGGDSVRRVRRPDEPQPFSEEPRPR
jgi:hypothetical protein